MNVTWAQEPEPHDYPAAISYLSLITDPEHAHSIADELAKQPVVPHKAKDVLRAANLRLLPADDPYVAKDLARVKQGKALSPVLLVRGTLSGAPLIVADGYHRVCASYHVSEDTDISAQIVTVERD
ncbi:MAG TPA: hypothetical protein VIJ18_10785 [Microbacteriaceae bacterium]